MTVSPVRIRSRHIHWVVPWALPVLLALAIAISCGKDSPARSSGPSKIEISPTRATLAALGETVQLSAKVLDGQGQPVPNAATVWSSANPVVASVDENGLVTARAEGETNIRATSGQRQQTVSVVVAQVANRIVISPGNANLTKNRPSLRLNAVVFDANGHPIESAVPVWSSSDPSIATVDGDGRITALASGETLVTASAGPISASITVLVEGFDEDRDRAALTALYRAAGGMNWTSSDNWASQSPLNEWYGVITNDEGRVSEIYLDANGLAGNVPAELGQLATLETLSLAGNLLTGHIPAEIGNLKNLRNLLLAENRLTGGIPPELGQLVRLEVLALNQNTLTGKLPPELGKLTNLRVLLAAENEFDPGPIPSELTSLARLELLALYSTGLCIPADPEVLTWIDAIQAVLVDYCDDASTPGGTPGARPREVLFALYHGTGGSQWTARTNWLSAEPLNDWFGVTTGAEGHIARLDLSDNNLKGALTGLLAGLDSLSALNLSDNAGLTGPLPLGLVSLDLQSLHLNGTGLCAPPFEEFLAWLDTIPDRQVAVCSEPASFDRVALMALYGETGGSAWINSDHWLTDAPLGSWHGVTADDEDRVTAIRLPNNNLTGRLPTEGMEVLDRLTRLNLSGNHLAGTVPAGLGALTRLTELDLSHNLFSGPIPGSLGQLRKLRNLRLAHNRLTGRIDANLGELEQLVKLDLSTNRIEGPIPSELGLLSNLVELNLGTNGLTAIPGELGQLEELVSLRLEFNVISGPIPAELGNLDNLEYLSLFANALTGPIPTELGQLKRLSTLNLDLNRLSGTIPVEFGQMSALRELLLDDNVLTGPIPAELGQLKRLSTLSLAGNLLTGAIPDELGEAAGLSTLSLSGNGGLSGPLPRTLTQLNLQALLLANTMLCAPADSDIRIWLNGIDELQVSDCAVGGAQSSSAYLTQGIQHLDRPVPLIAGEAALLRVFVVGDPAFEDGRPPVRATFFLNDGETHSVLIPASESGVPGMPDSLDEGDLSLTSNAEIPAKVIQPGLEMVVEIDPEGSADAGGERVRRVPVEGRLTVDVLDVPPLNLTLVPFLWISNPDWTVLDRTAGLSAEDDLFRMTRDVLPVGEFELTVREPFWTSANPDEHNAETILGEVMVVRAMDGADGHYMGILNEESGIAEWPGKVTASSLDERVIAHELGHNMFLRHAPCGDPAGVDPDYPHEEGRIGAWGYDLLRGSLVEPSTYDLMSYCEPGWISAYHFTRASIHRLSETLGPMMASAAAGNGNLLVWGGVSPTGGPFLNPAFVVDAPPSLPASTGSYRLVGEDPGGNSLFNLSMDLTPLADGDGSAFAVILPIRSDWPQNLYRMTLTGPGGAATIDQTTGSASAILLDQDTGALRGVLRDWPTGTGAAAPIARRLVPEPGLRALISTGVPDADSW